MTSVRNTYETKIKLQMINSARRGEEMEATKERKNIDLGYRFHI